MAFDGKAHVVTVGADGFTYKGKTYRSLSAIAKQITSTQWNGFLFFGLVTNYTFTSGDAGSHTFISGVTLKTSGSQSITATDTATGTINGSGSITVNPATAAKLRLDLRLPVR